VRTGMSKLSAEMPEAEDPEYADQISWLVRVKPDIEFVYTLHKHLIQITVIICPYLD